MFSAARYVVARVARTLRHKIQPHNVAPHREISSLRSRKFKAYGLHRDKWLNSAVDWRSLAAKSAASSALNFTRKFKFTSHSAAKPKSGEGAAPPRQEHGVKFYLARPLLRRSRNLAKAQTRLISRNLAKTRFHSEQNSPETRAKNLI